MCAFISVISCCNIAFDVLLCVGEEVDNPPKAHAGLDKVVQPHEIVMLNGVESKDDYKIVDYKWELVSGNPLIIIEVIWFNKNGLFRNRKMWHLSIKYF